MTTQARTPETSGQKRQASPYVQSMDAVHLTPEQKEDLVNSILAQYAAAPASAATPASATSPRSAGHRISRRSFAALLSAAAIGAGACGAAFALSQAHIDVTDILETFFGGSQATGSGASESPGTPTGGIGADVGSPIGASATSDGVTITVDAVVGDATNAAIVLTVERADGSDLGTTRAADTGELMVELGIPDEGATSVLEVEGLTSYSASRFNYDADPDDNAVQVMFCIRAGDSASLIGKTVRLSIPDLRDSGVEGAGPDDWPVIAQGPWDIEFVLDYEDSSCAYVADQDVVAYENIEATVTSVRVSKVALSLGFSTTTHAERAESLLQQLDWDRGFMSLPIGLVMDDGQEFSLGYDETREDPQLGEGTQMSSDYPSGFDPVDPTGDYPGSAARNLFLGRIIEPEHVHAARIGDTLVEVTLED